MLTRWMTYKLTDIFLFIGKTQCIFPDDVFDISDDSVVHHWKARGRQSSGDQSTSGNVLMLYPAQGLPFPSLFSLSRLLFDLISAPGSRSSLPTASTPALARLTSPARKSKLRYYWVMGNIGTALL
jgi:hypothetical protein